MKKYVLAIDQGTSSSRAILFDQNGKMVASSQKEITMIYEHEDYVEQDAYDVWKSVLQTIAETMLKAEVNPDMIASIGITNQRETTVLWNNKTHEPIYKAIVWQSKQSKSICDDLIAQNKQELFHNKTGLVIDSYFSATKIKWILDNIEGAKELMNQGDLSFGTMDSWLLYKLSGHTIHKTDYTNASRTMLYNIFDKKWDLELLETLDINQNILPEVCSSDAIFGYTSKNSFFGYEIPLAGVLGDQQAALFGQCCYEEGMIKNTYGTGCFMLMNTGKTPTKSQNGLLTTIAYSINNEITYALEGSVFVAGSAIQWLRDALEFFKESKDSEQLALSVDSNYGVYVVPSFVGLGTPYWDSAVKGAMFGLTRGTTKAHITRATLESLAFQTKDIIDVMEQESNIKSTALRVDGGAALNNFLMQFQSDICQIDIIRPENIESTAKGAAYMSGLAVGFYRDIEQIKAISKVDQAFHPQITSDKSNSLYTNWQKAVKATRIFK